MEDCLEIGRMLEMDEEDTKFCLRYLHSIGSLMHYTNVPDDWLKNHMFCTPEVIFTSISQLIIAALRILHSEGHVTEFEREELIKMGQFSLEAIIKYVPMLQRCSRKEKLSQPSSSLYCCNISTFSLKLFTKIPTIQTSLDSPTSCRLFWSVHHKTS